MVYAHNQFNIRLELEAIQFLRELYNFESIIHKNIEALGGDLKRRVNEVQSRIPPYLGSLYTRSRRMPGRDNEGHQNNNGRRQQGGVRADEDEDLINELLDKGYILESQRDPKGTWTRLTSVRYSPLLLFSYTDKDKRTTPDR